MAPPAAALPLSNTIPHVNAIHHTFHAATGHKVPAPFGQPTVCHSAQYAVRPLTDHPSHAEQLIWRAAWQRTSHGSQRWKSSRGESFHLYLVLTGELSIVWEVGR